MRKTKAFSLIRILNKKQKSELIEFSQLSFLTKYEATSQLIQHLCTVRLDKVEELSKPWIIQHVFNSKAKINDNWKYILKEGYTVTRKFILLNQVDENIEIKNTLLSYFIEQGLPSKMIESLLSEMEKQIEKLGQRDYYYHFYKFKISHWKAIHLKLEEGTSQYIQESIQHLYYLYLENTYRLFSEINNQRNNYTFDLKDPLPPLPENIKDIDDPVVQLYHQLNQTVFENKNLDPLISSMLNDKGYLKFDRFQRKAILEQLINHCIFKIQNKEIEYAQVYLNITKQLEKENVLLDKNKLSWQRFKNIITATTLINNSQNDSLQETIEHYKKMLPADKQVGAEMFGKSKLDLKENKLDSARINLLKATNLNVIEKIGVKRLALKIYFEDGDLYFLDKTCKSFQIMLKRNQNNTKSSKISMISEILYLRCMNFISLVSKLAKGKNIQAELENFELYSADYLWLKNKINQL